jgi:hypothetical protein
MVDKQAIVARHDDVVLDVVGAHSHREGFRRESAFG